MHTAARAIYKGTQKMINALQPQTHPHLQQKVFQLEDRLGKTQAQLEAKERELLFMRANFDSVKARLWGLERELEKQRSVR